MTAHQVLAALAFAVCVALLAHMALGARRQARLEWWWQGRVAAMKLTWRRWRAPRRRSPPKPAAAARAPARDGAGAGAPDSTSDSARSDAEREAADLIERARRGANGGDKGSGSGNVIRPPHGFGDRSKGPRRDLH